MVRILEPRENQTRLAAAALNSAYFATVKNKSPSISVVRRRCAFLAV
jgi:hypothetical protein